MVSVSVTKVRPALQRPSPHSWNTGHGLEVVTGPDVARVVLPEASQINTGLLDAAAGHVATFGTPPNETVCLSQGIILRSGVWSYESGVTYGRCIMLEPGGRVGFWAITGTPMVWTLEAHLDAGGNLHVGGGLIVDGTFQPTGVMGGGGPRGTVRQRTSLARLALSYDTWTGATNYTMAPMDSVVYDTGGFTGIVPNSFVVPIPGYYSMNAQLTFRGAPGNNVGIRFMLSDQQTSGGGQIESSGLPTTLTAHQTLYATPGDAIYLQFFSAVPDLIAGAGRGWTFMEIKYEGEP